LSEDLYLFIISLIIDKIRMLIIDMILKICEINLVIIDLNIV